MSSREAILGRVRQAVAGSGTRIVPATYRGQWDAPAADRLERFIGRLHDYGVAVLRARLATDIARTAAQRLREQRVSSLLVPPDLPREWRPEGAMVTEDSGQAALRLEELDGVMTGCAIAIAETGTIVLDAGAAQGRRAVSLVPDYYLCVVRSEQVVGIVPEAISRLHQAAQEGRPLTFISGPSATADIELSRVAGVHGPRRLDVVLFG